MRKRNASFGLILLSALTATAGVASADTTATSAAGQSTTVSSGSIIVYPTATTTGANPNGAALTLLNTNQAQYFYIRNTGTVRIVSLTITISYSSAGAKTSFHHCGENILFSGLNTCASGSTTLVPNSGTTPLNLSPGSWYAFEIDTKKTVTPTISVTVSTSQIRPALDTSS
jgi:hypothetical protein